MRNKQAVEHAEPAMDLVACPECLMPAEVERRDVVGSTDGALEMIKIRCLDRHWFYLPTTSLPVYGVDDRH